MWVSRLLLVSCIASSLNCFAADDAIYLDKGKPAPFDGYLITPEKADKIHDMKTDLDAANKVNGYLQEDNKIYEQRLTLYKDHNADLAKQLVDLRESTIWSKVGFFVLGAVVTTGVAFGVSRAIR